MPSAGVALTEQQPAGEVSANQGLGLGSSSAVIVRVNIRTR